VKPTSTASPTAAIPTPSGTSVFSGRQPPCSAKLRVLASSTATRRRAGARSARAPRPAAPRAGSGHACSCRLSHQKPAPPPKAALLVVAASRNVREPLLST